MEMNKTEYHLSLSISGYLLFLITFFVIGIIIGILFIKFYLY